MAAVSSGKLWKAEWWDPRSELASSPWSDHPHAPRPPGPAALSWGRGRAFWALGKGKAGHGCRARVLKGCVPCACLEGITLPCSSVPQPTLV